MEKCKLQKKKELYIECLRILAAFFVIYNHNPAFTYYQEVEGTMIYWISLCLSAFCKFSVSMFFMISGTVLLGKEEEFKFYFQKRVVKTGVLIVAFSLLQNFYQRKSITGFSVIDFLKSLYKEPATSSYWFLYLYLAFIITLPFLRSIALRMTKQEFYYIVTLAVIFNLLPILNLFFASDCNLKLRILETNIFYPLIGYYIANNMEGENRAKERNIVLGIVALIAVGISAVLVTVQKQMMGEFSETYLSICILPVCLALFIGFKDCKDKISISPRVKEYILFAGKGTMGVYLLGNIIREIFEPVFECLCNYILFGIANFIYILLQFITGVVITNVFIYMVRQLKKICAKR